VIQNPLQVLALTLVHDVNPPEEGLDPGILVNDGSDGSLLSGNGKPGYIRGRRLRISRENRREQK
jgi:hypothetical protein